MAGGTQVRTRTDALLTELLREVDTLRPYVRFQLRGWPNDVDAVLQIARETVWHRCSTYDPERGSPHAFAFGITRHVVLREIERKYTPIDDLTVDVDVESESDIDPLEAMIRLFDAHRGWCWSPTTSAHPTGT